MARNKSEERLRGRNDSNTPSLDDDARKSSKRRYIDRSRSRDRRKHGDSKRCRTRSRSPYRRRSHSRDLYNEHRSRRRDASRSTSHKRRRKYSPTSRNPHEDLHQSRRHYSRSRSPTSRRKRLDTIAGRKSMSPAPRNRSYSHKNHKRSRHSLSLSPSTPPRTRSPPPSKRSCRPLPSQKDAYTSTSTSHAPKKTTSSLPPPEKQKPNYAPTGLLAAETNTVANTSIVLKYHEPPDSRLPPPSQPYLLYIFKADALLSTLPLHERSCWLFGREKVVADVPIEHPSCSKQHAVLQFRFVVKKDEWGEKKAGVGLYVLDLDSSNGSWLNGERVEGRRYVEVRHKDVLRWGSSEREYVVLVPPKEKEKEGK